MQTPTAQQWAEFVEKCQGERRWLHSLDPKPEAHRSCDECDLLAFLVTIAARQEFGLDEPKIIKGRNHIICFKGLARINIGTYKNLGYIGWEMNPNKYRPYIELN